MTEEDCADAARVAGLPGWKASLCWAAGIGRYVAVLTSPEYNPVRHTGIIKVATGRDRADAFARVLEAALGCVQPSRALH